MAKGVKPRVKVPKSAAAGDVITIKTLISHKMESGVRKDGDGNIIPRSIINRFVADFNGQYHRCDFGTCDFNESIFPI
jgi:sulfur-oxidizing protein SoxZ